MFSKKKIKRHWLKYKCYFKKLIETLYWFGDFLRDKIWHCFQIKYNWKTSSLYPFATIIISKFKGINNGTILMRNWYPVPNLFMVYYWSCVGPWKPFSQSELSKLRSNHSQLLNVVNCFYLYCDSKNHNTKIFGGMYILLIWNIGFEILDFRLSSILNHCLRMLGI